MVNARDKELAARFSGAREIVCDATALGWHALLLVGFAALCAGALSPALFVPLGFCAYIRNFNGLHEGSHARRTPGNPLRRLRLGSMIVHSPLQLGREELVKNHRLHHAYPGDPHRDPHAIVTHGRWWRAALNAALQPELTAVAYIRRAGRVDPGLRRVLAYNTAMSAALVAAAGADIVWWLAVTRLGSTACWFIFDWCLHHPRLWGRAESLPLPRAVQWVWAALFSRDNLEAARHHALHHRFPSVADRELPALARALAARGA
jgi:fatty acid desaturase